MYKKNKIEKKGLFCVLRARLLLYWREERWKYDKREDEGGRGLLLCFAAVFFSRLLARGVAWRVVNETGRPCARGARDCRRRRRGAGGWCQS